VYKSCGNYLPAYIRLSAGAFSNWPEPDAWRMLLKLQGQKQNEVQKVGAF
jgi:hypothetical protein